jgi:hypothetical protein
MAEIYLLVSFLPSAGDVVQDVVQIFQRRSENRAATKALLRVSRSPSAADVGLTFA